MLTASARLDAGRRQFSLSMTPSSGTPGRRPAMARKPSSRDHVTAKLVTKSLTKWHENGPQRVLREPFYLVAGTVLCLRTSE
jgi:hypothetical protein